MKTCPTMQEIIEQIAAKHEFDLSKPQARLRLEMEAFDPLEIRVIHEHYIVVAHYYEPAGHGRIGDPEVSFYITDKGWVPTDIVQLLAGYRMYVAVGSTLQDLQVLDREMQEDLSEFCFVWAANIKEQGWLEDGRKHDLEPQVVAKEPPPDVFDVWPEPETEMPDEETLAEWFLDGCCEATDGCPIEPDGVCPHGHPSWFLRLGLV